MLGFIIEEGESRTQCDIICCFIHWPPGGALLRQQHSLINSGPHTGPLSRLFWECRRCTYWNPKLNLNLSSVWHGMIFPICNTIELTYPLHISAVLYLLILCRLILYYLLIFLISPWAGISHTSIRLTPFICCLCILSHVRTSPGRNDSQAGPSNYKGKDKAL